MERLLKILKRKRLDRKVKSIINYNIQPRLLLLLSIIVLATCSAHAGLKSSTYFDTNSDALIATHQFSDNVANNTVALPGSHANLLISPILFIQGHLPYHYKSFVILNSFLVFATTLAWGLLLIKLFGRKHEVLILLLLSMLLFTSFTFVVSIGNTTFRNLAYPIAFWFVFIACQLAQGKKYSSKEKWLSVIGSILFGVVLAGDGFFNYATVLPILLIISLVWIVSRKITRHTVKTIGLVVGVLIFAQILKFVLSATGVIYFDNTFIKPPAILPIEHLLPSLGIALEQVLRLQGAFIFSQAINITSLFSFINLAVLITGIAGLLIIIISNRNAIVDKRGQLTNSSVLVIMATSYFIVFAQYVLSGYVITVQDGQVVDYQNARYIAFLPLITLIGFVWIIRGYRTVRLYTLALPVILLIGILTSAPAVNYTYAFEGQQKSVPSRESVSQIITLLRQHGVTRIVTDFWYGPPIRFWSDNSILYAPQISCNRPLSFDSREDWYTPEENVKSALIVNRGGLNFGYWSCTDEDLVSIYGQPVTILTVDGVKPTSKVHLWVYDTDARRHIRPFPTGQ